MAFGAAYLSGQASFSGDTSPLPLFPSPLPGATGVTGGNAYTTSTASFTQVAAGATVSVSVGSTAFMAVGQALFIQGAGYYNVTTIQSPTTVLLTAIGPGQVVLAGVVVATGQPVVPSGYAFSVLSGGTGTNGANAFTTLTSPFNQVASGSNVSVTVASTAFMAVGQALFIATSGYYTVASITSSTVAVLTTLAYGDIASTGTAIAAGSLVTPSGYPGDAANASAIALLNTAVSTLQAAPGGNKTSYGATAPSSPNLGDTWFNTTVPSQPILEVWTGAGWTQYINVGAILSAYNTANGIQPIALVTVMPSSPTAGQMVVWQGSAGTYTPHTLYIWTGSAWTPSITSITPSMISANLITGGMIQAGAITSTQLGTGLLITTSAQIGSAVIYAANIATCSAGSLTSGTVNAQTITLGITGSSGIIQSQNYVTGVSGWSINGSGSAEFSSLVVRGTVAAGIVSNACSIYNPGNTTNVMNSVACVTGTASPGVGSMGTGLYYSLCTFYGWANGGGTVNSRFGKPSMTFLCTANYAYTLAGANQATTNIVYRINGGGWSNVNPWAVATVGPKSGDSISYSIQIPYTFVGTEYIEFGTKHADSNSGDTINVTNLTVSAFNF